MGLEFRKLHADEIEVRASIVKETGVQLLLYKDARVDQRLLDLTVGAMCWQREHQLIGGNLYCTVSIYCKELDMWVSKQDVGTESYTEKEKGQASDSFKRACFNWGIGRELYTAPFIWIDAENAGVAPDKKTGKLYCNERFTVQSIGYDKAGNINELEITNKAGKVVFDMNKPKRSSNTPKSQNSGAKSSEKKPDDKFITEQEITTLKEMLRRIGIDANTYHGKKFEELTPAEYVAAIKEIHAMGEKK